MSKTKLELARHFAAKKKFDKAIIVLDSAKEIYRDTFDYYLTFGIVWLYAGVPGHAEEYFNLARKIKINNAELNLGLAAVFLHKGRTDKALTYYLEVLRLEPENKIALNAIEFIRCHGEYETILAWFDTGKIKKFFPKIKTPFPVGKISIIILAILICSGISFALVNKRPFQKKLRIPSSKVEFELSSEEKKNPQEKDISQNVYKFIYSEKDILTIYQNALDYFNDFRDNMAQLEVNKLMNSNASTAVKKRAETLEYYFSSPSFDDFSDNFTFADVSSQKELFNKCYVMWSGKITNSVVEDQKFSCDLLIGDENLSKVEGIVRVEFDSIPKIEGGREVKILGQIKVQDEKIILKAKSVYQPIKKF